MEAMAILRKMWTITRSNKGFYEGDNHKYRRLLIRGPAKEKRFNSAFKMFMRNQKKLRTTSTPSPTRLSADQEFRKLVDNSESERLAKRFNRALTMILKNNREIKNPENCPCSLK